MREGLATSGFRRLLTVRIAAQVGDGLFQAGIVWLTLLSPEAQRSPERFVAVLALLLLPFSVVAPFVGLVLDRWHRRTLLVLGQSARAVAVAGVAVLSVLADSTPGWPTYALVLAVLGTGRLVLAALSASVPQVVPTDRLVDANTLAPVLGTGGHACGLWLGVVVVALGGSSAHVLALAAAAAALAALSARGFADSALGPDSGTRPPRLTDVARDLGRALRHLAAAPLVRAALLRYGGYRTAYGALTLLAFVFATTRSDAYLAALAGGVALGYGTGALTTPFAWRAWGLDRHAVVVGVGGLLLALASAALGPAAGWPVVAFALGLVGQVWKVQTDTRIQRGVDDDERGQAFVLYDVLVNVAYVAGAALLLPLV
ncbi:MFS transporter [Mumia flava]|uniref:MFS transporter n=1 Tax=Mumia flava TaxID=1348852 RepID=A0A2M9BI86_9ACTN